MNLVGKKIFVLGCSYSHHDGPLTYNSPDNYNWEESWPAMLSLNYDVDFVANASIPGSSIDTLYQRSKILLEEFGNPDLVIVQLTYPTRFLWSDVPVKDTINIKKINTKYVCFDHSENKWKKYAPLTPGNVLRPLYFVDSASQTSILEKFLLTDYFNTCTEKEIACLENLFGDKLKFFTHGRYVPSIEKEIKESKKYIGDVLDWLDIPFDNRNELGQYFIDEHLHLNKLGHRKLLEKLIEKL